MNLRARMKPGVRPIVLSAAVMVPEHPHYWSVPARDAAAVEALVQDGQIEYEPAFARAPEVALQQIEAVARPAPPAKAFQRKGR